ncbi:MAG: S8 family peptidase, partial [Chloroflexota bacterium]|nr:S8 family peptidase [Chloroflexota bacterium]
MHRRSFVLRLGSVALAGLTLLSTVPTQPAGAAGLDSKLRLHPLLQSGALLEPDKKVNVIVQKKDKKVDSATLVKKVDSTATVQKELPLIGGFLTSLSQKQLAKLASDTSVRYVSPDARVRLQAIDTSALKTTYETAVGIDQVWNSPTLPATGKGVTVAVLDTGVNAAHPDLKAAKTGGTLVQVNINPRTLDAGDQHGHGTHVVGTIKGRDSLGRYIGAAPDARVISVKVADDTGMATESDLVSALQWVYDNRGTYNIRAVNLSIISSVATPYTQSPINAYVEQLWFSGIAVVVAAGNGGSAADAVYYAPANDPYVITVGALDDNQTALAADDSLASFSSRGITQDGFAKPDVVAPGRKVVSTLASQTATLAKTYPDRITDSNYIRLSGTSMAAPVVTGTVALLLERFPSLTPNQVKALLTQTAVAYPGMADTAGAIDPRAMLTFLASGGQPGVANEGLTPASGLDAVTGTVSSSSQAYWNQAYWNQA